MKTNSPLPGLLGLLLLLSALLPSAASNAADDADLPWPAPAALAKGFQLLRNAGPAAAMDAWQEGNAVDDATARSHETAAFRDLVRPLANYRSFEVVKVQEIGRTARIAYVTARFERGVVFARFVVWKSDRDWVIQHMDFHTLPERVMPWLAAPETP